MKNLIPAFIKARAEFKPVSKDSVNPHFKNRYASLDAMIDATRDALALHGLAVLQPVSGHEVLTILWHESGDTFELGRHPIPEGLKSQEFGSAVTYARRYSYAAALGIVAEEDDDGQAATAAGGATRTTAPAKNPDDPKAHHSPERRRAAAALFQGLDAAFGDGKPWENARKVRVLKEVFGTGNLKQITAMSNTEWMQLYNDHFDKVLEAAVKATNDAKAEEDPADLPF